MSSPKRQGNQQQRAIPSAAFSKSTFEPAAPPAPTPISEIDQESARLRLTITENLSLQSDIAARLSGFVFQQPESNSASGSDEVSPGSAHGQFLRSMTYDLEILANQQRALLNRLAL